MPNQLELLQAQLFLMFKRMERLEERLKIVGPLGDDKADAGRVAVELGIDPVCVVRGDMLNARIQLTAELSKRGWKTPRIADALGCAERSVVRWKNVAKALGGRAKAQQEG